MVDVVQDYTAWMFGTWFNQREMARLSLGPFLAEVGGAVLVFVFVDNTFLYRRVFGLASLGSRFLLLHFLYCTFCSSNSRLCGGKVGR